MSEPLRYGISMALAATVVLMLNVFVMGAKKVEPRRYRWTVRCLAGGCGLSILAIANLTGHRVEWLGWFCSGGAWFCFILALIQIYGRPNSEGDEQPK